MHLCVLIYILCNCFLGGGSLWECPPFLYLSFNVHLFFSRLDTEIKSCWICWSLFDFLLLHLSNYNSNLPKKKKEKLNLLCFGWNYLWSLSTLSYTNNGNNFTLLLPHCWLIESLWVFIVSFLSCLVHSHFNNGDLHDILVEGCICKTSVAIHLYTHSVDQFLNLFSFVLLELCLSIYTTTAFLHFQSKKKKKSQNI